MVSAIPHALLQSLIRTGILHQRPGVSAMAQSKREYLQWTVDKAEGMSLLHAGCVHQAAVTSSH